MKSSPNSNRRGAVLVQFAVLATVLLAIATLASDLGLMRLTQISMQNAVDAGSLEGVRWQDQATDGVRRERAKNAIRRTFDEDANVTGANTYGAEFNKTVKLGAGPIAPTFAQAGIHGAGGLDTANIGVYLPDPQANLSNARWGDLVAGVHDSSLFAPAVEQSNYERNDFDPAPDAEGDTAFLARLRRTPNYGNLDAQPGVSSTGGGVPLLFGLGPLTVGNTGQPRDIRRDGIAVRAHAVAAARPVVAAGPLTLALVDRVDRDWNRFGYGWPLVRVVVEFTVEDPDAEPDVEPGVDTVALDAALCLSLDQLLAFDALDADAAERTGSWSIAADGALVPTAGSVATFVPELRLTPLAAANLSALSQDPGFAAFALGDNIVRLGHVLPRPANMVLGASAAPRIVAVTSSTMSFESSFDDGSGGSQTFRHDLLLPVVDSTERVVGFVAASVFVGPAGVEEQWLSDLDTSSMAPAELFDSVPTEVRVTLTGPRVIPVNARASDVTATRLAPDLVANSPIPQSLRALAPVLVR